VAAVSARFRIQYFGNTRACRTEAEIIDSAVRDGSDATCAVVYESPTEMATELLPLGGTVKDLAEFQDALKSARTGLLRYVNRRGRHPPLGLSVAGLSLWLMEKDGGTAMGAKMR
jgi:hypothetical protein